MFNRKGSAGISRVGAICLGILSIVFSSLPEAPGGVIQVNSADDSNNPIGPELTLREALLIAKGQRQPGIHPTDPDEQDQVSGTFGAGVADEIHINFGSATVNLLSALPALDDSTDSIFAFANNVLDGTVIGALAGAFSLTTNGHSIRGFTYRGFGGTVISVTGANNTISQAVLIGTGSNLSGISVSGANATGNTFRDLAIRNHGSFGIVISSGAHTNTFDNVFVYDNGAGIMITDSGTNGNVLMSFTSGLTEAPFTAAGNDTPGVRVTNGAKANIIGRRNAQNEFSFVSNNIGGGIVIDGAGTDDNVIEAVWLGYDAANAEGVGNSVSAGIEVTGGAKRTQIGALGLANGVLLGGHSGAPAIHVHGVGTDGTTMQRVFVGGVSGGAFKNKNHGIALEDGVQDTTIGGLDDTMGASVDMDFVGAAHHGVFINGNNPEAPIKNTKLNFYHFGTSSDGTMNPGFGGDVIHVTGNVDGLQIGAPAHSNHTNDAAGYGIRLTGPNVRNVTLNQVFVGNNFGFTKPNRMGGILITDGAHDITFTGPASSSRSYIAGNGGPGLMIDATGALPSNITVQNAGFGMDNSDKALPNTGDNIWIKANPATSPVALTGIVIGSEALVPLAGCVIGSATENGIKLENVAGVRIVGNRIGTNSPGNVARPNEKNGILLEFCESITIGSPANSLSGNLISANKLAGVRFTKGTRSVTFQSNRIGTNLDGDVALGNEGAGIVVEASGPPSGTELVIGGSNPNLDQGSGELGEGNLISGTVNGPGIHITAPTGGSSQIRGVRIEGNQIGVSLLGDGPVPNQIGVLIEGAQVKGVTIGHKTDPTRGNVISGNKTNGVEIDEAEGWKLWGNTIGADIGETMAIANEQNGVKLSRVKIGEIGSNSAPFDGMNIISGNTAAGILVTRDSGGAQLVISHNRIGTNGDGDAPLANQRGIVVTGPLGLGQDLLTIGGRNSSLASHANGTLEAGNLISGNTLDGIQLDGSGADAVQGVRIQGNLIGVKANGAEPLPNMESGVQITGQNSHHHFIGDVQDEALGNVISGGMADGVDIDNKAHHNTLGMNHIGCGADPETELPNENHGVWMSGGALLNLLEKNVIHFNRKNGVRISDAMTAQNALRQNSIHRNELEGIRILDGANGGIQAPRIDHLYKPGRLTSQLRGTTPVNGTIEVFTDPIATDDKKGYWGQGKDYDRDLTPVLGGFVITLNTRQRGIVTATVTDANFNTSEFSEFGDARVIQTLQSASDDFPDPSPLLVANKQTVVRVYTHTGTENSMVEVTGALEIGGAFGGGSKKPHNMRPFGTYDRDKDERRAGRDALNIYAVTPPGGAQNLEVLLKTGVIDRGRLRIGTYTFQSLAREVLAIQPVFAPPAVGAAPIGPNMPLVYLSAWYFANVYPVDPVLFMRSLVVLPPLNVADPPDGDGWQSDRLDELDAARLASTVGGLTPTHILGPVAVAVRINPRHPDTDKDKIERGVSKTNLRSVLMLDSKDGEHTGPYLAHEIGHTDPYKLADTYAGGKSRSGSRNRMFTSGPRWDSIPLDDGVSAPDGNIIPENDFAFNVAGTISFRSIARPGPATTVGDELLKRIYEFMSNTNYAYIDAPTNRILFEALGGTISPPLPKGGGPEPKQAPAPAPTPEPALIVSGVISTSDTLTLDPLTRLDQIVYEDSASSASAYRVEMRDGANNVLAMTLVDAEFDLERLGDDASGEPFGAHDPVAAIPFSVTLRDNAAARLIIVFRDATELGRLEWSPTSPTVTLLEPNGPGPLTDEMIPVRWMASDSDTPDPDDLWFDVIYTPDGQTMYPVATDLRDTDTLTVRRDDLPGGDQARFIVTASDGWNRSSDQSNQPVTLEDRAPMVAITRPRTLDELNSAQEIGLEGFAYDPEDRILMDGSLVWTLDGGTEPIATGIAPIVELPEGPHTLRLTATDSAGHVVTAEIGIEVTEPPVTHLRLLDYLLGRVATPPAGGDVNSDGAIDMADLLAFELAAEE